MASAEQREASDKRVVALVRSNTASLLMDFPLPAGLPLAKASKAEVSEAAKFYLDRSDDMGSKGRWLAKIAGKLPKGKTVSEALSEADLVKLRD